MIFFAGIIFRRPRSILKRKLNHRLLEEEQIQEHEQHNINQSQEHEQQESLQQLNSEISEQAHEGQGKNTKYICSNALFAPDQDAYA